MLLEPADRVEVEGIGRLVEEEQAGLLREADAEMEPAALAAGQARERTLEITVGEAEVLGDDRDSALELVAAGEVIGVGRAGEAIERLLRAVGGRVLCVGERSPCGEHAPEAGHERLEDGADGRELVRLARVGHRRVAADDDSALIGLDLLADEAEQRRLAGPVGRDERGALARLEGEGDPRKQPVRSVAESEVGDLEDGHDNRLLSTPERAAGPTVAARFSGPDARFAFATSGRPARKGKTEAARARHRQGEHLLLDYRAASLAVRPSLALQYGPRLRRLRPRRAGLCSSAARRGEVIGDELPCPRSLGRQSSRAG